MKPLLELVGKGGPAMMAIMVLSVVLYARCFHLLLHLRRASRAAAAARASQADQSTNEDLAAMVQHQRLALGAMIAAAPLLGLLGTVSGMVKTFESLSTKAGDKSMEGLARGISEVLVATESGLLVALPALLLVYLAHRAVHRHAESVNRLAARRGGLVP